MNIYKEWEALSEKEMSQKEYDEFWKSYLETEKNAYQYILSNNKKVLSGKVVDLAAELKMDNIHLAGFISGINTSLITELDLEKLEEDSEINFEIDYEKLYYNMHDAKASWLYELPEWDGILSSERRKEISKEYKTSQIAVSNKIGRNEPCTCGSGKKYKKCCGK